MPLATPDPSSLPPWPDTCTLLLTALAARHMHTAAYSFVHPTALALYGVLNGVPSHLCRRQPASLWACMVHAWYVEDDSVRPLAADLDHS